MPIANVATAASSRFPRPVSYTHLDVYKRQRLESVCTLIGTEGSNPSLSATFIIKGLDQTRYESVNSSGNINSQVSYVKRGSVKVCVRVNQDLTDIRKTPPGRKVQAGSLLYLSLIHI